MSAESINDSAVHAWYFYLQLTYWANLFFSFRPQLLPPLSPHWCDRLCLLQPTQEKRLASLVLFLWILCWQTQPSRNSQVGSASNVGLQLLWYSSKLIHSKSKTSLGPAAQTKECQNYWDVGCQNMNPVYCEVREGGVCLSDKTWSWSLEYL